MGNTTGAVSDYAAKAQNAAVKTANATTQAVSGAVTMVGNNKVVAATASTVASAASSTASTITSTASSITNMAGSAINKGANTVLETRASISNRMIVDISNLYDCELCFCETELTKGNGVAYNTLEYVMPVKNKVNQTLKQQVDPMIQQNIKHVFGQIAAQMTQYNRQKDNFLVNKVKEQATKLYGFDVRRHEPIVSSLCKILSRLLDFKNVEWHFVEDQLEARLDKKDFTKMVDDLESLLKNSSNINYKAIDFEKIKQSRFNHSFSTYFNNKQVFVDVTVGFVYENIKVRIYKHRLFGIIEREIETVIDEKWDEWMKIIKTKPKMDIKLVNSTITLSVHPQSSSKVNFVNNINVIITDFAMGKQ